MGKSNPEQKAVDGTRCGWDGVQKPPAPLLGAASPHITPAARKKGEGEKKETGKKKGRGKREGDRGREGEGTHAAVTRGSHASTYAPLPIGQRKPGRQSQIPENYFFIFSFISFLLEEKINVS